MLTNVAKRSAAELKSALIFRNIAITIAGQYWPDELLNSLAAVKSGTKTNVLSASDKYNHVDENGELKPGLASTPAVIKKAMDEQVNPRFLIKQ